jgi:hypothetical protein
MAALHWLKKFNKQYNEIEICEANLSWITNGVEQELPIQSWEEPDNPASLPGSHNEDLGPSPQQIADQVLGQDEPTCFGICTECNANKPKQKDKSVVDALISAEMQGKLLTIDSDGSAVHFPYVSPDPVCEYSEMYIMEYALPWLFPGGTGGYMSGRNPKPNLKDWLKMMKPLHGCGRFDHDRLWAFFALNYYTRHQNQSRGGFYMLKLFSKTDQKRWSKFKSKYQKDIWNG